MRYFAPLLLAMLVLGANVASGQSVWELTPYEIRLVVVVERSPHLPETVAEDLADRVIDSAKTHIGAPWRITSIPATPALRRLMPRQLDAVTMDDLPAAALEADKVMLLAARPEGTIFHVVAREFDTRAQTFNAPVRWRVGQAGKLPDVAFRAVRQAFAPLATVAGIEDDVVTLRARAGGIPTRDPTYAALTTGMLFRPIIRYTDREGAPRRITPVPWTYLSVETIRETDVLCKLSSGLRSPLSGRRRGRIEQLALAINPAPGATRLVLTAAGDPETPLFGYDVFVQGGGEKASWLLGHTDRRGAIQVEANDDERLVTLLIRHGGELLARLPIVPGLEPELTAEIANDDQRLEAEGYLTAVQEDLIDQVALRHILALRIRSHLKKGETAEALVLFKQLRDQRSLEEYLKELAEQRKRTHTSDPLQQRKLEIMFQTTRKLFLQHLDPAPIKELENGLREAQATEKPTP